MSPHRVTRDCVAVCATRLYVLRVGKWLFVLFTVVPLIELYLLIWLGGVLGFLETCAIVLVTGLVGAFLAKREGLRVLRSWQDSLAKAEMPEEGVLGGVLVLVGGVLLVTPGVLTDAFGLSLLFPPTRALIAKFVRARIASGIERGTIHVAGGSIGASPFATSGAATFVRVAKGASAPSPRRRPKQIADAEIVDVEFEELDR